MLFKLVVVAAVAACFAAGVVADQMDDCNDAFQTAVNTETGDAICTALATLDSCVAQALVGMYCAKTLSLFHHPFLLLPS